MHGAAKGLMSKTEAMAMESAPSSAGRSVAMPCDCGCSGAIHIHVPMHGKHVKSGVVHHMNVNRFFKLDSVKDGYNSAGHVMCDGVCM